MHECCHTDIYIIQGDTSQINVTIEGVPHEAIEHVYFSCGRLELTKELSFDNDINKYVLLFSSTETSTMPKLTTNFDITVKLFDSKIKTGLYQGKIIIAEKNNPVEVITNGE